MLKRDRSPRKQSPSGRRARSRHALFTDENYFNAIFAHANVGATRLDRQGRFVAVNDRFCEITGYSREELLSGMTPLDLSHPDDRERDRELLMPFVEGR
ncbi:MAG TPA: PAS domain-containing protein, partial [Acidobacteriota bacterium]|nr:PAS domain-containing protein [Acidobacteriota bacterium]